MADSTARPGGLPAARAAVFAAAVLLAIAGLAHYRAFYHDDAFITLRYVQRLLAGSGLTWTDGPPVEGFTHPLWLGQIALLGAAGVDLVLASRLLGLAYLAGLFALWWRSRAWGVPLLVVASLPGMILWTLGGLETVSFCFWLLAGAWLAREIGAREPAGAAGKTATAALMGLAFAAAALTRPEGLGAGLIAVAWLAASRRLRAAGAALGVLLLPVAAYGLFRLAYFGDTVPNPARVKVDGLPLEFQLSSAAHYLRQGLADWAVGLSGALAVLVIAGHRRSWLVAALCLPIWASILLGGGDHMIGGRFMVPIIALVCFAAGVEGAPTTTRRAVGAVSLACLAAAIQAGMLFSKEVRRDRAALEGAPVGRFLDRHLPAGALVATATAGSTAYFAPSLRFLDTLGLNDRHIARRRVDSFETRWQVMPGHAKGDGAYVLERKPDVVILGRARGYLGADPREWFLTDYELLRSGTFRGLYGPWRFDVPLTREEAAGLRRAPAGAPAGPPGGSDGPPGAMEMIAWLRRDSPAAAALAQRGQPLLPPDVRP